MNSNDSKTIEEQLKTDEIQQLVSDKISILRKRLLDSSRKNALINIKFSATSRSNFRIIDELPEIVRHKLTKGETMRLAALPALELELPDENTDNFLEACLLPCPLHSLQGWVISSPLPAH